MRQWFFNFLKHETYENEFEKPCSRVELCIKCLIVYQSALNKYLYDLKLTKGL